MSRRRTPRTPRHRRTPPRRGFTITELLVVAAITSLLLGLLMPALGTARGTGRTVQSLAHLRQMAFAAQQYADHWDRWPPGVWYESAGGGLRAVAWDWRETADGEAAPGPLWAWTDHPEAVLQCPEYHGSADFGGDPATGYNYNTSHLGGEAPYGTVGLDAMRWGVRPGATRRAAATVIFGAGGRRGGTNKFMRDPGNPEGLDPWTLLSGGQAFRYQGGRTPMAFLDGHVAGTGRAWLPPQFDAATADLVMGFPDNGFLAPADAVYDPR